MTYDEFIEQVQQRAELHSRSEAEQATRAVLETLAEHVAGEEVETLAAPLPPELGIYLRETRRNTAENFSLDEFFRRVNEREGVKLEDSIFHTRVVCQLLSKIEDKADIVSLREQLPREFRHLFKVENIGDTPAQGSIDTGGGASLL